jgi:hypothetical protein
MVMFVFARVTVVTMVMFMLAFMAVVAMMVLVLVTVSVVPVMVLMLAAMAVITMMMFVLVCVPVILTAVMVVLVRLLVTAAESRRDGRQSEEGEEERDGDVPAQSGFHPVFPPQKLLVLAGGPSERPDSHQLYRNRLTQINFSEAPGPRH